MAVLKDEAVEKLQFQPRHFRLGGYKSAPGVLWPLLSDSRFAPIRTLMRQSSLTDLRDSVPLRLSMRAHVLSRLVIQPDHTTTTPREPMIGHLDI